MLSLGLTDMSEISEKRKVKNVYSKVGQAVNKYALVADGDRIMVGVSGGKDSMSLLSVLSARRRFGKEKYEVVAVHIDVENVPYSADCDFISDFCRKNDVEFVHEVINVDFEKDPNKSKCFVCSWHRRKRLFELTQEYNCNKLALGHHLDDAVETLLINMCYHNSISSMPAKLSMFDGRLMLIRPLILLTNSEIRQFSNIMGFPTERAKCPFEDKTKRYQAGEIIADIEKRFPDARHNIFKSMQKIFAEYLPVEEGVNPIVDGLNVKNR